MPDVVFNPSSWDKAGKAFTDEGTSFSSAASAAMSRMDIATMGCNNGGTLADGALSIIFPVLLQAMNDTIVGISGGVAATGEAMTATATAYRNTEQHNKEAADDGTQG